MPVFVCAGIPRSGSTWLYNAMRLVLQTQYRSVYSTWIGDRNYQKEAHADATLIKIHNQNEKLASEADVILTSHRDPRDIVASMSSMGWIGEKHNAMRRVQACRAAHEFWSPLSVIDLAYTDIVANNASTLRRIARSMNIDIDSTTTDRIIQMLADIPNNRHKDEKHDPIFLTHANHRNDGRDGRWKDQLDPAVATAIVNQHRDWIERLGYSAD